MLRGSQLAVLVMLRGPQLAVVVIAETTLNP
jgi:hypothetical protein